jgi:hypothetical protein
MDRRLLPFAALGACALAACGPSDSSGGPQKEWSLVEAPDLVPVSWTKGQWFVDPQNATGAAGDKNDCATSHSPCLTYAEIANRWGTLSPRLRQSTAITFLSSHVNGNDPVRLDPYIENGAMITIQGVLGPRQVVATGTLGTVAAKNRATGQLLQVTLPPGAQPGQLVVNKTHPGRAWIYKASGAAWLLSQPTLPETVPPSWNPQEVNSWAAGDQVTLYQPVAVNVTEASPTLADCNNASACTNDLLLYQLTVLDPGGVGRDPLVLSGNSIHVSIVESSVQRSIQLSGGAADWYPVFVNDDFAGPIAMNLPAGYVYVFGGLVRPTATGTRLVGALLANDAIVGTSTAFGDGMYGAVFIDSGATLSAIGGVDWWWTLTGTADGTTALWGPGAVDVTGSARFEYPSGATGATTTFLQTGGLTIDGQSTACAIDAPGTGAWTCGITLTPAHLDAARTAGGFGGLAAVQGGASLSNVKF